MKKRISAELISIAHRILKLKNHSETVQLQQEAKNLYDQLTILRFYEENFEMVKNEISEEVLEAKLEGKKADVFEQPIPVVEEIAPEKEVEVEVPVEDRLIFERHCHCRHRGHFYSTCSLAAAAAYFPRSPGRPHV